MMGRLIGGKRGRRGIVIFSAMLILASLVLLGTGFTKVSGARSLRRNSRSVERERWSAILDSMSVGIPAKYRSSWKKIAEEHPEMMIRLASTSR